MIKSYGFLSPHVSTYRDFPTDEFFASCKNQRRDSDDSARYCLYRTDRSTGFPPRTRSRWLSFRCRKQQKQPAAMPLPLTLARLVATGPVPACPHPSALPHAGEGGTPVSGRGCGAYRSRSLGSRASRKASPKRLKPKTVRAIARPGKIAIHGAVEAYSSAPPCSIRPQAGTGSCTPSPR